ncbi:MAG: CBS domain-containing protein [Candidatus Altarchaeum sp.]|nr:CBS domain-containing protein [Candidatus Altarchaeum sp.]
MVNLSQEPIGLITKTDILRTISEYEQKFFDLTAQDIMSKSLITIPATTDVERVEKEMKRHKIKHCLLFRREN